jgi:Flp pilus assembly protein TadD
MPLAKVQDLLLGEPGTIVRLKVIPEHESDPRVYEIERDATAAWVKAVVDAADRDPWRRRLRQAYDLTDDAQQRTGLANLIDEAAVETQPVRVLTRLAVRLEKLNAVDSAIRLLRRVRQRHPDDLAANMDLAILLQQKAKPRQLDEAVRYFTAAIALRPDSAGLHDNLAWLFATAPPRFRRAGEALQHARKVVTMFPQQGNHWTGLGAAQYRTGDFKAAVGSLGKAIDLKPGGDSSQWFFLLARSASIPRQRLPLR